MPENQITSRLKKTSKRWAHNVPVEGTLTMQETVAKTGRPQFLFTVTDEYGNIQPEWIVTDSDSKGNHRMLTTYIRPLINHVLGEDNGPDCIFDKEELDALLLEALDPSKSITKKNPTVLNALLACTDCKVSVITRKVYNKRTGKTESQFVSILMPSERNASTATDTARQLNQAVSTQQQPQTRSDF